jgi:glycosyltransferase involved in cell wall biosynthesis
MISFGATDYSFALANALADYCDIDFYYSKYHVAKEDISILDAFKNNTNIKYFECYRNRDIRNMLSYNKFSLTIRDKKYDVIHIQEYGPPWLYFYLRRWNKVPIIMTVHDPYQHQGLPFLKKAYQDIMQFLFIRKSKIIIVLGDILKKQLNTRYTNLNEKNVAVIRHGDLGFIRYWNDDTNKREQGSTSTKQILMFGSVRANKGLDYLLKAEKIMRSRTKNYEIIIAGKFDDYEKYKKTINNNPNIRVIDKYIEYKDIPEYFNNAAFVVLPYISATQSGVAALSFTFGKPIVATKVGALPEMIQDGKTGLLVEPRNELCLADAIIKLLSDEKIINELCESVRKYCKENMSWASIAEQTIEVYNRALQMKKDQN